MTPEVLKVCRGSGSCKQCSKPADRGSFSPRAMIQVGFSAASKRIQFESFLLLLQVCFPALLCDPLKHKVSNIKTQPWQPLLEPNHPSHACSKGSVPAAKALCLPSPAALRGATPGDSHESRGGAGNRSKPWGMLQLLGALAGGTARVQASQEVSR